MSAALIGSLIGLGAQGVAMGMDQSQRRKRENELMRTPSTVDLERKKLAQRLSAQVSSGGPNPLQRQRAAARAQSDASLGFANASMNESATLRRELSQLRADKDAALNKSILALGAGAAAAGASLATTAPGANPAAQVEGPGGALSRLSAGAPSIAPPSGSLSNLPPGSGPLGFRAPPALSSPAAGPQVMSPYAAPIAPAATPMPPAEVPLLESPQMRGEKFGTPSAPLSRVDPRLLRSMLGYGRYGMRMG